MFFVIVIYILYVCNDLLLIYKFEIPASVPIIIIC